MINTNFEQRPHKKLKLKLGLACFSLLFSLILWVFLTGPDPTELQAVGQLAPPSWQNLAGTDMLSRDYAARLAHSGLNTIVTSLCVICLGAFGGLLVALGNSYIQSPISALFSGLNDLLLAFPALLLALVSAAVFGNSQSQLIIALGIAFIPSFARVLGAEILQLKSSLFIRRLEIIAAPHSLIIFRQIIPLLKAPLCSALGIGFINAMLAEASLSYLGLGLPNSKPSWGSLLKEAQTYIFSSPKLALLPGLAIILTGLSFYLIFSGLNDLYSLDNSNLNWQTKQSQVEPAHIQQVESGLTIDPDPEQILAIDGLSLHFKGSDQPILNNLCLHLNRGECLGILGDSGAGKSLTALSISGLNPVNSVLCGNSIIFCGKTYPISDQTGRQQLLGREIAHIFQDPLTALNPLRKIGYQLSWGVRINQPKLKSSQVKQLVHAELAACGLDPELVYNKYPHQLSGGMRQRALIALALINRPKLLIADEPTTALDQKNRSEILALLKRRQEETGLSMIFISHDLRAIKRLADRVMLLDNGQLSELGQAELDQRLPILPPASLNHKITKPSDILLDIKELSLYYQDEKSRKPALKGLNLKLRKNEILGMLGESGAGKTSLLRLISGELSPSQGSLCFRIGDSIEEVCPGQKLSRSSRRQLGLQIIHQNPASSLNPGQSLVQNVSTTLLAMNSILKLNKKQREEAARAILYKVGLDSQVHDRLPGNLSGGQQQRAAIAAACVAKPQILLADEAVSALDSVSQQQVLDLILDLKSDLNFSCVFISHDPLVLRSICDRVCILSQGQITDL